MSAEEAYQWLIKSSAHSQCDEFDIHIIACVFALAIDEADRTDVRIADGVGLERPAIRDLAAAMFPDARAFFDHAEVGDALMIDEEEQSLRDILGMYCTGNSRLEWPIAAMIARRCKWTHHLWQDLGLPNRSQLSQLMKRHFARLAEKNQHDMKWKKFLYRMVCGSEGFTLCTAPVCSECDDFANCFGAEDGEALLARRSDANAASEKAA